MSSQPPTLAGRTATRSAAPLTGPATRTGSRRTRQLPESAEAPPHQPAPPTIEPKRRDRSTIEPISITVETVITGAMADALCDLQLASFEPLAELAIQRQTDTRDELVEMFANPDFAKVVAWQGGNPVGLGVLTNVLERVPEISPPFLRKRYPDAADRNAIYVGIYVTVAEHQRGVTLFSRISTEMWNIPARAGGILVFDMCEFNRTMFAADQLAEQIASVFPRSQVSVVDRQTWYVAELPEPLPGS